MELTNDCFGMRAKANRVIDMDMRYHAMIQFSNSKAIFPHIL
jgi:hypothetical protein